MSLLLQSVTPWMADGWQLEASICEPLLLTKEVTPFAIFRNFYNSFPHLREELIHIRIISAVLKTYMSTSHFKLIESEFLGMGRGHQHILKYPKLKSTKKMGDDNSIIESLFLNSEKWPMLAFILGQFTVVPQVLQQGNCNQDQATWRNGQFPGLRQPWV